MGLIHGWLRQLLLVATTIPANLKCLWQSRHVVGRATHSMVWYRHRYKRTTSALSVPALDNCSLVASVSRAGQRFHTVDTKYGVILGQLW